MSDTIVNATGADAPRRDRGVPALFAVAIFTSASLVFVVQPMVTKLVLPMLGGSPSVWNTSMVFFQAALLAGYAYAHALQRISSLRTQVIVHLALLALAALTLPLHVASVFGEPDPSRPILWLLGTLAASVGAPFAVLSATAPLLQAWYARVRAGHSDGQNPYVLYAASNLGSFLALLSYPIVIEPLATLTGQRWGWSGGYLAFIAMIVVMGLLIWTRRTADSVSTAKLEASPPISLKGKLILVLLAAAPSSLMLGVTTHLSTDVASAPFLWVAPLALYLLTFVIAFQSRPWIRPSTTLLLQAAVGAACVVAVAFRAANWGMLFAIHLSAFFLAALMCHQALAARRPAPDRLTEFYLLLSLGGVVGGAFTALVAPVIFNMVWEYPLVLVLVGLARPWGRGSVGPRNLALLLAASIICMIPIGLQIWLAIDDAARAMFYKIAGDMQFAQLAAVILAGAAICAFMARDRALVFTAILAMTAFSGQYVNRGYDSAVSDRSFFGVLRVAVTQDDRMGGDVHVMTHGTTLHGAQARDAAFDCTPTLYYAPTTPIGRATETVLARGPARIGVVGQGSGAMAAYKRAGDTLTFFEIDPMVNEISRDPRWFTYINGCAVGPVETVFGDAKLTLEKQPKGVYDLLLIDAFSSDAVPTHLLTEEAIELYAGLLKPTGVLVLHLSNRNLDITEPAIAAAQALGLPSRHSLFLEDGSQPVMAIASTEALAISPTEAGLAGFGAEGGWTIPARTEVRPWTDDYVNLFGALWRRWKPLETPAA